MANSLSDFKAIERELATEHATLALEGFCAPAVEGWFDLGTTTLLGERLVSLAVRYLEESSLLERDSQNPSLVRLIETWPWHFQAQTKPEAISLSLGRTRRLSEADKEMAKQEFLRNARGAH
jgi:hypothetical protein